MKVLNVMFGNQDLCKLLYYTDNNPLAKENISNTKVLLNQNIIPKPFEVGVIEDTRSIVIIYFDRFTFSKSFENGYLYFDILCHESLWDIKGGERPLSIFEELEKTFNDQKIIGIGKMEIVGLKLIPLKANFKGYSVSFKFTDFN